MRLESGHRTDCCCFACLTFSGVTEGFVPQFFNRPASLARFEIKSSEINWKVTWNLNSLTHEFVSEDSFHDLLLNWFACSRLKKWIAFTSFKVKKARLIRMTIQNNLRDIFARKQIWKTKSNAWVKDGLKFNKKQLLYSLLRCGFGKDA